VNTHTALHIMKDGKIVEIRPAKEVRYPLSAEVQEEPELSFVREDAPPYGNQRP